MIVRSRTCLLLLSLCALIVCSSAGDLKFVQDAKQRGALCNDGSPAGFYFGAGSGTGINTWLIHLQGGYACFDDATCLDRAKTSPALVSSTSWPAQATEGGIFSSIKSHSPTFYNANKVYVQYCSSDYWSGTRGPIQGTHVTDSWYFQGHNISRAVVQDLQNFYGMNTSKAEILFTGCSAGGKGVFLNADYAFKALNFVPAKFLAFADEGWSADVVMSPTALPYFKQFETGWPMWQSQVPVDCNNAHPQHIYLCFFGSIVLPYLDTPVIMTAQQYDIVQYGEDGGPQPVTQDNAAAMMWMEILRTAFRASFRQLIPPHTMFSPACATHCSSLTNSFFNITIGGVSISQALDKFWVQKGNIPNIIEDCPRFNCSVGCP